MATGRARILPDDNEAGRISAGSGFINGRELTLEEIVDNSARYVMKLWNTWAEERNEKEKVWLECEKAYLSQFSSEQDMAKWKSKAFVPVSYNAAENIHAQLMSGLFPNSQDFFEVTAMDEEYEVRAGVVKELLKQQLLSCGFRGDFAHFVKQLIVIGNSAALVDWQEDNSGYAGSRFKTLDMKYFHVDPFAEEPQKANKLRKYWMTEEEARASDMFDKEALDEVRAMNSSPASGQEDSNKIAAAQAADRQQGIDPDRGGLEITELWGTFEIDGKIYENHVISVGNGHTVLRFEKSPYAHGRDPFIFTRYSVVAGEVYGVGALEPALPLQHLINTFTNQKVDELSLIINGTYKYVDDGVIDVDELVNEPGALFEVGDIGNLEAMTPSTAVSLAYTEIQDLERKFEEATGALKLVVGGAQATGDRTTATEVLALTQSGNARFNETLAHIENTALAPALRLFVSNAAQFMSKKQAINIVGVDEVEDWIDIEPKDLKGRYDIQMGGSKLVGVREMRLRNMMQYAQTIGQIEPLVRRMDWDKFDKKLWRELGFDNDESMLKPEQPTPQTMPAPQGGQQATQQAAPPQMNPQVEQMLAGMETGMEGETE